MKLRYKIIIAIASLSLFGGASYKVYSGYSHIKQQNQQYQEQIKQNETLINDLYKENKDLYSEQITYELKLEEKDKEITQLKKDKSKLETENKNLKKKVNNNTTTTTQKTTATGNKATYQAYAKDLVLNTYKWSEADYNALVTLWERESNWNPTAKNKSSGAYGIPQALPASKMASYGSDYLTNYKTQIKWGLNYIKTRYGTPTAALNHSNQKGWY